MTFQMRIIKYEGEIGLVNGLTVPLRIGFSPFYVPFCTAAWKIIKGWLPPRFVDRVKFLNKKTLKEFIDVDNQLAEWGGKDKYTYKFEPEILPAAEASADSTPNGHVPNGNATPVVNGQGGKEKVSHMVFYSMCCLLFVKFNALACYHSVLLTSYI